MSDKAFHTNTYDLRDALASALLAAGKDSRLPLLQMIKVSVSGKTLRLEATDSFRLLYAELADENNDGDPAEFNFLLPKDSAKVLVAALGKRRKTGTSPSATVALNDAGSLVITHEWGDARQEVPFAEDVERFPNTHRLLAGFEAEPAERISFNPQFLADLCKMPRERNQPLTMRLRGTRKPGLSEWEFEGIRFSYLLIPVRQSA